MQVWRPFALTVAVIGIPFALFLIWTETGLRPDLESRAATQLARTIEAMASDVTADGWDDALADRLGEAAGLRVTFIGPDGQVLGDSEMAAERLSQLDNHGARPEVLAARAEGRGYATRSSRSVALPLFYVAVQRGDVTLRVAAPQVEILEPLTRARQIAAFTAGLALLFLWFVQRAVRRADARVAGALRQAIRGLSEPERSIEVPSATGILGGLAGDVTDVTHSLAEQRAVNEERYSQLVQMLDAVDDGIALCDSSGRVVRTNRAFMEWTGTNSPEGQPVGTLFRHPGPRNAVAAAIEGRQVVADVVLGTRTSEVRCVPLGDGAILVLHDLTRTRQLEGVRRDFVANVSHELKTPLTSIRGFAEPLAGGELSAPQAAEFSQRIVANVERMQLLVDDLLDLTRIESGVWEPEPAAVDIVQAANSVWAQLEPVARAKEVGLEIDVEGSSEVMADPDSLRQILANLFDNAVRYAPEGTVIDLGVTGPDPGGLLRIEVRDRGPGIESKHLLRVFERFYRADPGRARSEGGTGLGLSIVNHLVTAHGCDVGIDSELGAGTTVWFNMQAAN